MHIVRPGGGLARPGGRGGERDQRGGDRVRLRPGAGVVGRGPGGREQGRIGVGVVQLVVAVAEAAAGADRQRRSEIGERTERAGHGEVAAELSGLERAEVQLHDHEQVAGVAGEQQRGVGVGLGDRVLQRADGAGAGDRVAGHVVLGGAVVVAEGEHMHLLDVAAGRAEREAIEDVVGDVFGRHAGEPVDAGGRDIQIDERPVAGRRAGVIEGHAEAERVAEEDGLPARSERDLRPGRQHVAVAGLRRRRDREPGLDLTDAGLQLPVAAEVGVAGVVVAGGDIGPGEGVQRVEQLASVAVGHVAAVQQQVG